MIKTFISKWQKDSKEKISISKISENYLQTKFIVYSYILKIEIHIKISKFSKIFKIHLYINIKFGIK